MSAADTLKAPDHGWDCFHCGIHFDATFSGQSLAKLHFGTRPNSEPACALGANPEDRKLLRHLRWSEDERQSLYIRKTDAEIALATALEDARRLRDVVNAAQQVVEWASYDKHGRASIGPGKFDPLKDALAPLTEQEENPSTPKAVCSRWKSLSLHGPCRDCGRSKADHEYTQEENPRNG